MTLPGAMTAERLAPGDRILDHEDGDLFVIDVIEPYEGNQLALVDDDHQVLIIDRDELLFLDTVMPRVWRYKPDSWGGTMLCEVEFVGLGDIVTLPTHGRIEVMGVLVIGDAVTLYERGEPAATLDRGSLVEVDR
jgi:hypothetical protein